MSNMSYCRFENTLADLRDCLDNLDQFDSGELSKFEARSAHQLIKLAKQIADNYEDDDELEELYSQYKS